MVMEMQMVIQQTEIQSFGLKPLSIQIPHAMMEIAKHKPILVLMMSTDGDPMLCSAGLKTTSR